MSAAERIPAPPASFQPTFIARRYISADIRAGHDVPAYAQGWETVVDTGVDRLDVEIARRLNAGESRAAVARAFGLASINITNGSRK